MANQIVAGELYASITGQLFEIGRQLRQRGGYPYDPELLKKALQKAIEGKFVDSSYKPYLAPGQKSTMPLFQLEKHLESEDLLVRAYSLEDDLIKGWLANPATYPDEFVHSAVILWGSEKFSGPDRRVACLRWNLTKVAVVWWRLSRISHRDSPSLLKTF